MKVVKSQGSKTRTSSEIDLFSDTPLMSDDAKARVTDKVGLFLVEQILGAVATEESPVSGESWPGLSPEYKKIKKAEGASPVPNMELTGDMLNSLTFRPTARGVEVGFFGDQADKADGHNKLSGRENNTPKRRFLPGEGQDFKSSIASEVEAIIAEEALKDAIITPSELNSVETKTDLYDVLSSKMPGYTRSEIRAAVLANADLVELLAEFDILELL